METLGFVRDNILARHAVLSVVLIVVVVVLRWVLVRSIQHANIKSVDLRRRWIVQIRNACFIVLVLGLIMIWASELRTLALSLLAITVAVVLATRELILCLTGSFLKVSAKSFTIGDRIEVNNVRGDVIDQTLLSTKIAELGPGRLTHQYTGRTVVVPNSVFLTSPVINESFTDEYMLHTFTVPLKAEDDWQQAEYELLAVAREVCEPFIDGARECVSKLTVEEGLDLASVDPRVTISLPDPGRIDLIVRIPVPSGRKGRVEQDILRRYLVRRMAFKADKVVEPASIK